MLFECLCMTVCTKVSHWIAWAHYSCNHGICGISPLLRGRDYRGSYAVRGKTANISCDTDGQQASVPNLQTRRTAQTWISHVNNHKLCTYCLHVVDVQQKNSCNIHVQICVRKQAPDWPWQNIRTIAIIAIMCLGLSFCTTRVSEMFDVHRTPFCCPWISADFPPSSMRQTIGNKTNAITRNYIVSNSCQKYPIPPPQLSRYLYDG